MARPFSLGGPASRRAWLNLLLALGVVVGLRLTAAPVPPPAASVSSTALMPPATNAAGVPIPPLSDDQRYGHIVAPNNEPAHPLKLAMPLPDVGMVKVPTDDELKMRDKLEELAALSDDEIRAKLEKWPAYGKMSLTDEGAMLTRIQQFKDQRSRVAQAAAKRLGLLTLTPEQQDRFQKEYWDKRVQVDRDLSRQFGPIVRAREQKMQDDLLREFSASTSPSGKPAPPAVPPPMASSAPPAK